MVIRAVVLDGEDEVGSIVAMRLHPLGEPADDDVCRYTWTVEETGQPGRSSDDGGTVEHRHGDGRWALIARITAAYVGDGPH